VGVRTHVAAPWCFSAAAPGVTAAAPCLGADTDAVLREVCGYAADEIDALRTAGALS
jgi:crotonobetainyl-CoA:carnitine CoA-transferase CaiB-like acyl-CoA transferase